MIRRSTLIKIIVVIVVMGLGIPIMFNYNFNKSIQENELRRRRAVENELQRRRAVIADGVGGEAAIFPVDKNLQRDGPAVNEMAKSPDKPVAQPPPIQKPVKPVTPEMYRTPVLTPGVLGNYEVVQKTVVGPGEMGKPVKLEPGRESEVQRGFHDMGFNKVVSEMISLNRTVPDVRPAECKHWNYAHDMPKASVILIFLNEGWTTLLRTAHSIFNRSPPHLLHEIIFLDDFSNKPFLAKPLEDYVKAHFDGKGKVFRNAKREGLIRARVNGAKHATGDVIIFLDSHCEVNHNWLPPLLATIHKNPKTLAVPVVDRISDDTFHYRVTYNSLHVGIFEWGFFYKEHKLTEMEVKRRKYHTEPYSKTLAAPVVDGIDDTTFEYRETYNALHRGIFEWGFYYKENAVPEKEKARRKHVTEPYRSPTHAGGLFAIGRKYFFELGAYDPHLETWGGENFEISFKLWQCGGEQVWVPCSHVGHIYSVKAGKPYHNKNLYRGISNTEMNYIRVVETWFDPEHKEYFYTRIPQLRGAPVTDISEQLKFKHDHKCKSFTWFMENIAYDVYDKFPPPPKNVFWGQYQMKALNLANCLAVYGHQVRLTGCGPLNRRADHQFMMQADRSMCWDTRNRGPTLQGCLPVNWAGKKQFMMKANNMGQCWDSGRGDPILYGCHALNYATNNQIFRLNAKGQIGNGERCIEAQPSGKVTLNWCILGDMTGPWTIDMTTHLLRHTKHNQCVSGRNNEVKMAACDPNDEYQQWHSRESFPWKLDFPQ